MNSKYLHPKNRQKFEKFLGINLFSVENTDFRFYIYIRNRAYIWKKYKVLSKLIGALLIYPLYLIYKKDFKKLTIFFLAYLHGIIEYFEDPEKLKNLSSHQK